MEQLQLAVYHFLCTIGVLLVIGNAFAVISTGKFTLFGLDKLAGMIAGGIVTGAGKLLGQMLRAIGRLFEDGLRAIFHLPPRDTVGRRRQQPNNQEE